MDKFDDFILFPRLDKELRHLSNHPEEIDAPLIFHGLPGIGKTSFAKYLSEKHASIIGLLMEVMRIKNRMICWCILKTL